jgi:hypothetical protein
MPGEESGSTKATPVVVPGVVPNEDEALRRLVGEEEQPTGEASTMRDGSSELSSPPDSTKDSDSEEEEEEEEDEGNDNGRPNFRREKVDAMALKSDREWFNRAGKKDIGAPTMGTPKPAGIQKAAAPKSAPKKAGKGTVREFLARKKKQKNNARAENDGNIFATPGKLGGALASAQAAATEEAQTGGWR